MPVIHDLNILKPAIIDMKRNICYRLIYCDIFSGGF